MNATTKINLAPKPASIFKRFVAHFIDTVIVLAGSFLAGFIIGFISILLLPGIVASANAKADMYLFLLGTTAGLLIFIFYYVILESSRWQASLGKKMLGLYVATKDNKRLNLGRAFLRTLVFGIIGSFTCLSSPKILKPLILELAFDATDQQLLATVLSIVIFLVALITIYISVFFTKEKKTIYDMLTGTRVYARPKAVAGDSTLQMEPSIPLKASAKTLSRSRKK